MEHFDFLGINPKFYVFKKDKFQSKLGGILMILSMTAILTLSGYFIYQMISRSSLLVISNKFLSDFPEKNLSGFPFMMNVVNENGQPFPEQDKVFRFKIIMFGSENGTYQSTDIDLEACDINKHFGEYRDLFLNVPDLESFKCIHPNNTQRNFFGTRSNTVRKSNQLYFYAVRCQNNHVWKHGDCLPENQTLEMLRNSYIEMYYIDHNINHDDVDDPVRYALKSSLLHVSTTLYKRYHFTINPITYQTDYGAVFTDIKKVEAFQDELKETIYSLAGPSVYPGAFGGGIFSMSEKREVFMRSYTKFQNVIANIGGIVKAILTLHSLIYTYLIKYLLLDKLYKYTHDPQNELNDVSLINKDEPNSKIESQLKSTLHNINNLTIKENNYTTSQDNTSPQTKKSKRLFISWREVLCPSFLMSKNKNIVLLNEFHKKLKENLSIENVFINMEYINYIKLLNSQEKLDANIDDQHRLERN